MQPQYDARMVSQRVVTDTDMVPQRTVSMAESDRLTIRLSPAAKEAVEEIMRLGKFGSPQEAIRRAISDERFLQRWMNEGWDVILRKGKNYRELVWPTA